MTKVKTDKKYLPYRSAIIVAEALQGRIRHLCLEGKCVIAGSLRREEPDVGDIEIVCIPRYGKVVPKGEMVPVEMNLVVHHIHDNDQKFRTDSRGYIIKKCGPKYAQIIFAGMQCDIFMTTEAQWGRMLALRTGPESYSKKLATRWSRLGYKGHEGELVSLDGNRHKPKFPTEKSFFEFLEWNYVKPTQRR